MSNITSIHDGMASRMAALLPNAKRLANPYSVADNPTILLANAWGIKVLEGQNTELLLSVRRTMTRQMSVVQVRKVYSKELDTTPRADTEKLLLEDQHTIIQDFETNTTLNGVNVNAKYLADGGIQFIESEKAHFILIESIFSFDYSEQL